MSTNFPHLAALRHHTASLPAAGSDLLVALDIDGTLVRHDLSASPRVVDAVQAHLAAGTHIVICTGRGVAGAQAAMRTLGISSGFAVCSNGALIITVGDAADAGGFETQPLSSHVRDAEPLVRLLRAHTFDPTSAIDTLAKGLPQAIMAVESVNDVRRITAPFPPGELSGESVVVPLDALSHPKATRLTLRAPEMTAQELLIRVRALGLDGVEYAVGWSAWMDVSPGEVTKATGLQDVVEFLGLSRCNTVAVGDSGNDTQMLSWAKLGVAMGNAPAYVIEYADVVTASVDDDGAALVLEALL